MELAQELGVEGDLAGHQGVGGGEAAVHQHLETLLPLRLSYWPLPWLLPWLPAEPPELLCSWLAQPLSRDVMVRSSSFLPLRLGLCCTNPLLLLPSSNLDILPCVAPTFCLSSCITACSCLLTSLTSRL